MKKKILAFLACAMMLTAGVFMTACGGNGEAAESTEDANAAKVSYSVSVETKGGMAMSDVEVYVYADDTLADLKHYASTDEQGQTSFELAESDTYVVALAGIPEGYDVAASYAFSGNKATIVLTSSLITDEDISTATLGVGDVMYDFTVTTSTGEKFVLSEVLADKEMVLLNFWYTTCSWCMEEFPVMAEAYQQYSEDVAIIALDPLDGEDAVKSFAAGVDYGFGMASCPATWANVFGVSGYPTSVLIDRYGVICAVESGAITSLRPFVCAFEHFTGDDYEQKLCLNGVADLVTNVKPTYTMASSEEVAAVLNNGEFEVTYRSEEEGESAEYAWPFVATEKNGEACLYASNSQIDESFAIIYADVYLEAGQAFGFDYLASTEYAADVMYVIVDDDDIYQISGTDEKEEWKSCYPVVATESRTYEVALCYLKDDSTNEGDDTVYIKNARVVSEKDVDSATYLPRQAATTTDGFEYEYVDVVLNSKDGYYHVGSANGPLLLANLMDATPFSEEQSIHDLTYNGDVLVNGESIYEDIVKYCSYATNSTLGYVCTVNEELGEILKQIAEVAGFEDNENEWLKMCMYYQAYGTNEQLEDPIKGLCPDSAFTAKLGKNVSTNYFYYDRAIIPRGMFAEFIPSKSGVYRITSKSESVQGVDAWIFNEDKEELLVYEHCERMYEDTDNPSMVFYMDAGEKYYINFAFWDLYETGYIYYDVEYIGSSYQLFRTCSPGYFTYDTNATGDAMYYTISGGIKAVLGSDGYYYEDLGVDANGNQKYGSKIYADFTGITSIFNTPIADTYATDADGSQVPIKGMITKGGFDFSKTEEDLYVLSYLEQNDNDVEATDAYFRELWGEEYDGYAEIYQLKDVYEGRYHGNGEDLTDEIRAYVDKIDKSNTERNGCVPVDERLAEILQLVMDKYTFENVDDSWLKLCYYYDDIR
ncbi:MAG: TlpA family protein disulfide reductase [Roseburia sp.]|nr:TlpA family protein disulfide reductase [Roseburia sp.]